jgi:Putative transmembrane protein 170
MWYHAFLWALFSSILVHSVAAAIAFGRLRKHKIGRFIPVAILAMGFLWPITGGAITSE